MRTDQFYPMGQAESATENWCGVLQEVALPGCKGDPDKFMEAATRFANDR